MEETLDRISDVSSKQKKRFQQGLGADIAFFILIALLYFACAYVSAHPGNGDTNPPEAQILIYAVLSFFAGWDIYAIVKNSLGWYELSRIDNNLSEMRTLKSEAMHVRTQFIFSGFLYDIMDKLFSEYVAPLEFHNLKKKRNLISLNIRYAFFSFLIIACSIAWFVGDYVWLKNNNKNIWQWETILGLVVLILSIIFVFGYLVPRQVIINKQIKLNDQKKISEEDYYDKYKFFYVEKVLTKFWNRDNK